MSLTFEGHSRELLVAVTLEFPLELSVFGLQFVDLLSQSQDDVCAGEVDAEFVDQPSNHEQAFDIGLAVETFGRDGRGSADLPFVGT